MQFTTTSVLLAIAASSFGAQAIPLVSRQDSGITDADVLNYALTLEHLENALYHQALDKFDRDAFSSAGHPDWVRERITMIASHEETHVNALYGAIQEAGITPVEACEYEFGLADIATFITISSTVEAIGSSAYSGAAQFVTDKTYLTFAASVLATEARHSSWLNGPVTHSNPWGTAFETILSLNQVYSLAAPFITSCPESNPTLPVKAFPALTATASDSDSTMYSVAYEGSEQAVSDGTQLYAAVIIGLEPQYFPIATGDDNSMWVQVPEEINCGPAYLIVTSENESVADDKTVAGPAILRLPCNSEGVTNGW